jgi:hypothetical protein
MRMARPELVLLLAALSFSTACGAKGGDDDGDDDSMAGTGGTGGGTAGTGGGGGTSSTAMTLYGFDSADTAGLCTAAGAEGCWAIQDYTPSDAMYVNVFAGPDNATIRATNLSWDGGNGANGMPGRLKFEIPFTDWNQLADIQINFTGDMKGSDWTGKVLRADIMLESGASSDPSYPTGSYMFVKTGADYVWAKGLDANLGTTMLNLWQKLNFPLNSPAQADESKAPYDPAMILALGLQVYSGGGNSDTGKPTTAIVYVDNFTLQ